MPANMDEILGRLIERVESRYYGKYRGLVTDNADPENLGRVKAQVPRLLGEEATGWALPAFPYGGASEQGFFAVPDVGAGVWIEFEGGDLSYPIWAGTWYTTGAIPESAQPGKKVLKTKSGHKIVLDDDAGTVEITDTNGNSIAMDASVVKISTGSAAKIVIEAPQIELIENATHPLVFGDSLLQYLNQLVQIYQTHVHPGQMAAGLLPVTPAPPVPPFPPPTPALLSVKVKTG
jgi:phage baseplate assembly protein gpV